MERFLVKRNADSQLADTLLDTDDHDVPELFSDDLDVPDFSTDDQVASDLQLDGSSCSESESGRTLKMETSKQDDDGIDVDIPKPGDDGAQLAPILDVNLKKYDEHDSLEVCQGSRWKCWPNA